MMDPFLDLSILWVPQGSPWPSRYAQRDSVPHSLCEVLPKQWVPPKKAGGGTTADAAVTG